MDKARLEVRLTRDDIMQGIPGDPCNCPIANALYRVVGDCRVTVSSDVVTFSHYPTPFECAWQEAVKLPDMARAFIAEYDEYNCRDPHEKFDPHTCELLEFDLEVGLPQECRAGHSERKTWDEEIQA